MVMLTSPSVETTGGKLGADDGAAVVTVFGGVREGKRALFASANRTNLSMITALFPFWGNPVARKMVFNSDSLRVTFCFWAYV